MSEGFLADLGLDEIDDDPNAFPDGTYNAYLTEAKVVALKDAAKGKRLVLTYKIFDGDHKGKTIEEWKGINKFDSARDKAWLKSRMLSLGVPEDKINSISPDDLTGIAVRITKKQNGQYRNVTNVVLGHAGEEEATVSAASSDLL
jgi:uncharacterized protein involved in high-affinity Fe2+ transport